MRVHVAAVTLDLPLQLPCTRIEERPMTVDQSPQGRVNERTVAVKVLTTGLNADNVERFVREQRAMGVSFGHTASVSILQVGVPTDAERRHIMVHSSTRVQTCTASQRAGGR